MTQSMPDRADELRAFGVFIEDDVVTPETISRIAEAMSYSPAEPTRVYNTHEGKWFDSSEVRSTHNVQVGASLRAEMDAWISALLPRLADHFGVALSETEPIWFLRYRDGDHFIAHRDAEEEGHGSQAGRKVSIVLFVNDASEFDGGDLLICPFDVPEALDLAIDLRPKAGRVVAFRSHTLHQVTPVGGGQRFSMVTWAR